MTGVIIINVLIVALGAGIATQIVPIKLIRPLVSGVHNTVGVTMPTPEKVRKLALIWLAVAIVIVDGAVFLLFFLVSRLT